MATALHRLARLHCTSASSNAATVIVTSDQFRLLLAAIRELLPRFEVTVALLPTCLCWIAIQVVAAAVAWHIHFCVITPLRVWWQPPWLRPIPDAC